MEGNSACKLNELFFKRLQRRLVINELEIYLLLLTSKFHYFTPRKHILVSLR